MNSPYEDLDLSPAYMKGIKYFLLGMGFEAFYNIAS